MQADPFASEFGLIHKSMNSRNSLAFVQPRDKRIIQLGLTEHEWRRYG
jgi:hypothetical protein